MGHRSTFSSSSSDEGRTTTHSHLEMVLTKYYYILTFSCGCFHWRKNSSWEELKKALMITGRRVRESSWCCNFPVDTERRATGQYFWRPKKPLMPPCIVLNKYPGQGHNHPAFFLMVVRERVRPDPWKMKSSMTKVTQTRFVRQLFCSMF